MGLWHGIAGNAYMLHTLYRGYFHLSKSTDDKKEIEKWAGLALKWRTRVWVFAKLIGDEKI